MPWSRVLGFTDPLACQAAFPYSDAGESGEGFHAATRLARYSSSQPAVLRRRRMESFPGAFRVRLYAMCRQVAKLAGALSVLTRHSSSRKTMSMTQCREFSIAQWARIMGPRAAANSASEVM